MKKIFCFLIFLVLFSCKEYLDRPKNLIDKDTMAEVMAEMAINDQVSFMYQGKNLESGTRFILKNYNIKADDFVESYKYYVVSQKMKGIIEDAQKILLEKDPKAEKHVQDKLKSNQNVPSFAR
ncbi:DUF4296 domain-containing protein [Chryseobacterium caseinilyticum]|uniref:DUF4296 domain-containing protein n=1 Tax=Chryseobacterium caseinilyticum TaxID=2771428 RepID=A0ABR8ZF07_9FLAO|nr:DUF4296 domain-containing protein [Chryseobacterium caseinilyticum]MBD8083669.1 DUF4296 domain-containing protein [Chryseobacterium caseinilyticum]